MKIKGIPCALKSPVAVRLVKKFLIDIAKNFYRKEAKKQQTSSDFLYSFALFASSRWEWLISLLIRALVTLAYAGGPFLPCCKYGFPHSRKWRKGVSSSFPCNSLANACCLQTGAHDSGSDFPCSSVANAFSLLGRSPRIFTAKTLRPQRSSRQVRISYLPLRLRGENASLNFRVIPCSSVANASLCWPEPRIFTAKTRRTLRSIRQVRISCLPLRSLRLCGENAFK